KAAQGEGSRARSDACALHRPGAADRNGRLGKSAQSPGADRNGRVPAMSKQPTLRRWFQGAIVALIAALITPIASAHAIRPAYLQVDEVEHGRYQLMWRTPVLSGMRLPVLLRLPHEIREIRRPTLQELSDSLVERRFIDAGTQGLAGKRI